MSTIRFAVLGAGRIGQIHATNLAQRVTGAQLVACADIRVEAADELARRLGHPRGFSDYREVLDLPEVDAVVVCTPTNTHHEIIMAAAARGKQIFTEKPIALELSKIDEILAEVAARGVAFMVGFQRRYDPDFARVRAIVSEGGIGQVHMVRITSRDAVPPPEAFIATSGGLFLDMTIHDLDILRYVTGSEVTGVYAKAAVLVDPMFARAGDVDTAVITLTLANGALAAIDNSRKAVYGQDQRLEVFGSAGMVSTANHTVDRVLHADGAGSHGARLMSYFPERYGDAYRREMQAFVDVLRAGAPVPVTGEDGRKAVTLALAVQRSAREGRFIALG